MREIEFPAKSKLEDRLIRRLVPFDVPSCCWEWQGARRQSGHGVIGVDGGRTEHVHRVAWRLWVGPIPPGMHVLHHCDNPPCCYPPHLFLGTQADNNRDAWNKGRGVHQVYVGEDHPRALVSEDAVRDIRRRYLKRKITLRQLGEEYGLTVTAVHCIVARKTWRHVS